MLTNLVLLQTLRWKKKGLDTGQALKSALIGAQVGGANMATSFVLTDTLAKRELPKAAAVVVPGDVQGHQGQADAPAQQQRIETLEKELAQCKSYIEELRGSGESEAARGAKQSASKKAS